MIRHNQDARVFHVAAFRRRSQIKSNAAPAAVKNNWGIQLQRTGGLNDISTSVVNGGRITP
jgi:hypothetical protein